MKVREQLLRLIGGRDVSDRQLSLLATGSTDTIRNIRRGSSPRTDTLEALCDVLGVEIHIGPPRDDTEASPTAGREKDPPSPIPAPEPPVPPEIREALGLAEGASLRDAVQAIEQRLSGEAWRDEIKAQRVKPRVADDLTDD